MTFRAILAPALAGALLTSTALSAHAQNDNAAAAVSAGLGVAAEALSGGDAFRDRGDDWQRDRDLRRDADRRDSDRYARDDDRRDDDRYGRDGDDRWRDGDRDRYSRDDDDRWRDRDRYSRDDDDRRRDRDRYDRDDDDRGDRRGRDDWDDDGRTTQDRWGDGRPGASKYAPGHQNKWGGGPGRSEHAPGQRKKND